MSDSIDDQNYTQRFWNTFAQKLAGNMSGLQQNSNWFMPSAQAMIAAFAAPDSDGDSGDVTAKDLTNFDLALFDYANRIPTWAVSWTGNSDQDFFQSYKDYVLQLHTAPTLSGPALEAAQNQLSDCEDKLAGYDSRVDELKGNFFKAYQQQNMIAGSDGGTVWLVGFSEATMVKAWTQHTTSAAYGEQLSDLQQATGLDMEGISSQITALQTQIYGPGFSDIQEAQKAASKADPSFANDFDDDAARGAFQMKAGGDGWLPKYEPAGGDVNTVLQTYKKWLSVAQASLASGDNPKYAFSIQASALEQQNADAKLSFGAVLPIEEILMLDVSGGSEYKSANTQKEDFSLNCSYQDLFLLPVEPGRRWFNETMIETYGNPKYFTKGSPYAEKPLGGPNGIFNLRVTGILVCVGRKIEFTSQKFSEFDWSENFHAEASVSFLGFIHLGGGSVSESYSSTSMKTTDNGFIIQDTSGAPSVVGLMVQQVFQ